MNSSEAIRATGLARRFGAIQALRGVDLTLERGDSLALFGANGAGKTTLLRILGLGLSPDAGSLEIDGVDPRENPREARRKIGWVAHASLLYEELTARQNLEFWGKIYGVPNSAERAAQLLDELGLDRYADEPARILSRGLRQRLSWARAIVHRPALLLLDEPFTGLDPRAAAALHARLAGGSSQSTTRIVVTHRVEDGLALSNRWVMLAGGRIIAAGLSCDTDAKTVEQAYFSTAASA